MRRILVDHARARATEKRGGRAERTTLETSCAIVDGPDLDLLALDEALEKLARLDSRQARVVELRFFGGLSVEEVSELTGAARRTIELDWTLARAFLRRELERGS
jgi:RNA polymerase sigma factor (TIGR02999 family)